MLDKNLEQYISSMSKSEIGTCLTSIVEKDRIIEFLDNGIIIKLLEKLKENVSSPHINFLEPKYVVVECSHFGEGTPGWRLSEVDCYCFTTNYPTAKKIKESWGGYNKLSFIIKYENWVSKGGATYQDGLTLDSKRHR